MDITEQIRNGELRIERLDLNHAYVFRIGRYNTTENGSFGYMPTQNDLDTIRDTLENLYQEDNLVIPKIMITHAAMDIEEIPVEISVGCIQKFQEKLNRLKTID